jgi:hypothetical protein
MFPHQHNSLIRFGTSQYGFLIAGLHTVQQIHEHVGKTVKIRLAYQQLCLYQEVNMEARLWQHLYIISESGFKYNIKEVNSIFKYCRFYDISYHYSVITFHHKKILTIKPEGSSRETAKPEQKEKAQPAFRSSVSKQLRYIDIRGVSL